MLTVFFRALNTFFSVNPIAIKLSMMCLETVGCDAPPYFFTTKGSLITKVKC
jgi:hypothetical protein